MFIFNKLFENSIDQKCKIFRVLKKNLQRRFPKLHARTLLEIVSGRVGPYITSYLCNKTHFK